MKLQSIVWLGLAALLAGCGKSPSERMVTANERSAKPSTPEQQQFLASLASFHKAMSTVASSYESAKRADDLVLGVRNNSPSVMNMKQSEFTRQIEAVNSDKDGRAAAQQVAQSALAKLWSCYDVLESNRWDVTSIEQFLGSRDLSDSAWFSWSPIVNNLRTASGNLLAQMSEASAWTRVEHADVSEQAVESPEQQMDPTAQFELGRRYATGDGVEWNSLLASKWYRKAAEQNHPGAQVSLGTCYAKGFGVAQDLAEAVKWYRKAAEHDYLEAQMALAKCYRFGDGVQDKAEAVRWYLKAAEQNHVEAEMELAYCYRFGEGVSMDQQEAARWYRRAAKQGDSLAQQILNTYYR